MKRETKDRELFRLAGAALDGEDADIQDAVEPEELLPPGSVEIGGRLFVKRSQVEKMQPRRVRKR